jgi:hypothetical protein
VSNVKAELRTQASASFFLLIRDPREPVLTRLRELGPSFPGTETKVGSCEKNG